MSQHFAENGALLVEGYNALEREGKINISNRFLEAFQPEQFNVTGWPTRVTGEAELYRYLDSMHDGRLKWYYDSGMAPTEEEFEIINALCGDIDAFAHKQYGSQSGKGLRNISGIGI